MNAKVEFFQNRATEEDVATHLTLCDARFIPPLSSRVQISEYAQKIYSKAMRFEAWADAALVGMVAVYCEDRSKLVAYVTNVSVLSTSIGRHLASQLLTICVDYLRVSGFRQVELEVNKENEKAIRLYDRHGFIEIQARGQSLGMRLDL